MDKEIQNIFCNNNFIELLIQNNKIDDIKILSNFGFEFNHQHLELAFFQDNIQILSEILNQKIKPNEKCFLSFLNSISVTDPKPKSKADELRGKNIESYEKFNLLVESGYEITQDNFLAMTSQKIYLLDYEKYGLEFDEKIKSKCEELLFFPYNIIPSKEQILHLLKVLPTVKKLKEIIKKYKITPDIDYIYCLISANKKSVFKVIEFIHKKYIKLDSNLFISVLKNCSFYYKNEKIILNEYAKLFKKTHGYYSFFENIAINDELKLISSELKNYIHNLRQNHEEFTKKDMEIIISKYDINYDYKFMNMLCSLYYNDSDNYYVNEIIKYFIKHKNIAINEKAIMIVIEKNSLEDLISFIKNT